MSKFNNCNILTLLYTQQVAYMFLRAADILEIAEAFYPVILELGGSVQLLVLAIYRKDINRLLNDLQKFVKISNINIL